MPPKRRGTKAAVVPTSDTAAGPAGDASAGRRITRLRSRELGLEAAGAGDVASDDPGPVRKKRKVHPTVGGKSVRAAAAARADPPARPQRPDLPPYPKSGNSNDILNWAIEFRRICALPGPDIVIPCTVRREPEDTRTARDVASTADKSLILKAARSVVGISSSMPDGKILHCTGIVVDWNETRKLATIVTCSATVCYDGALVHPKPKLLVRLPNKATAKGQLLFFNAHYRIALLEALVDSPLEPANFGSSPKFGQQEEIQLEHGISDGFIVDMFEKYLLNLGWGFLGSFDSSWTTDLEERARACGFSTIANMDAMDYLLKLAEYAIGA
ncbi:hypothetical protein E2562_033985 [Oryza meyeriana var. granulata]|uniref:Uncharacterized protein n=1 Tax=Oryza meyeriana var. granulata TaxID=110450 RepID=A0A6G1ES81_9ORYZ|nr:hypothetical protein E2562_033985 [Oryza meyeriana var. granulata]